MGGDHGPSVVVPAAVRVAQERNDVKLVLVGDERSITEQLDLCGASAHEGLTVRHTTQVVGMDEPPSAALRYKKDSSMRVALDLVKSGEVHACVSAGNTGALMATAKFVLKTLPGIDRPAIISSLPTTRGHTHVLDLGANVDSPAEILFQFAVMGAALTSAVDNIERPAVGLLNVGAEEIKGNDKVKEAARLLGASGLNYVGFVEGDDIWKGTADVVVCDGFVGNVALKSGEGLAKMIRHYMRMEFKRTPLTRLAGLIAMPVLKAFGRRIDPRRYNGASLVGLQGIVIKSHGSADVLSFANAINEAILEVQKAVPQRISSQLATFLIERRAV